ncbi:hypothetical protein [Frankia canadensis]|uniref:hypothetical protein n=1 Tax=Frankia canadensis TaxID=1836972 RepID=UPI000C7D87B5|nr:hypothetical protein [Frankia canadensis]
MPSPPPAQSTDPIGRPGPSPRRPRGFARALPRSRRLRSSLVAAGATVALTGAFAVAGAGTAQAGGATWASCPSNQTTNVSVLPGPGEPGGQTLVHAGFYAHIGSFWPPSTDILCRTQAGRGPAAGQPKLKVLHQGCADGLVTFGVPRPTAGGTGVGGPPVTWGTFLPEGWYDLPTGDDDPNWTALCWSPTRRPHLTPPAAPAPAAPAAATAASSAQAAAASASPAPASPASAGVPASASVPVPAAGH